MDVRLAGLVTSRHDLHAKLTRYLQGESGLPTESFHHGDIGAGRGGAAAPVAGDESQAAIPGWVEHGLWDKVAQAWTRGSTGDWNAMYGPPRPRRVSLPTYPFARERYWLPEPEPAPAAPVTRVDEQVAREFLAVLLADVRRGTVSVEAARANALAHLSRAQRLR
jgi:acyl transferase domain-containing protein